LQFECIFLFFLDLKLLKKHINRTISLKFFTLKSTVYLFLFMFASVFLRAQTPLDTAVNFTVKDVNGVTHRLNEYLEQDKIVVIDFFTITCGPCVTYAPMVNESYNHFGCNSSNVIFLGINWGADNAGVTDFGNTNGVHYPEISGLEGNGNHVVADYQILSYPTVILILPNSLIAEKQIWPPTTQHLDSVILSHGGILSGNTTQISTFGVSSRADNKIESLYPLPARSYVNCITSVSSVGTIEICSLSGSLLTGRITVKPNENKLIDIKNLKNGYYLVVLRNRNGMIVDQKSFVVQNQ